MCQVRVAFKGDPHGMEGGVYFHKDGSLGVIVDTNTPMPGGTGFFASAGEPSVHNGSFAFQGVGTSGRVGIFTNTGGTLEANRPNCCSLKTPHVHG